MSATRATPETAKTLRAVRAAQRQLAVKLEAATAEIEALRGSTSWRLTAPLRGLVNKLYGIRQNKNHVSRPAPVSAAIDLKGRFRAVAARRLALFLASNVRISLPTSDAPDISLVIVLYNGAELTLAHLKSLVPALALAKCEVIIVDNASTDHTHELLARIDGARIIVNDSNLHFLRAVNQAARLARGTQLLLVNNDTEIEPESIAIAQRLIEADATIGAIGAKIVLLDGALQEAGCIVWSDGSASGYGRGADPDNSAFCFRRDVDYCSGAFLMIQRALFEQLGGFDQRFAPAYYEETDLCIRIRAAGFRVIYEPMIEVRHFEFGSAGSAEEPFSLQARNREIFQAIHRMTLQSAHFPRGTNPILARGRPVGPRLLIIGDRVPVAIDGVARSRSLALLRAILLHSWEIGFYALDSADFDCVSARALLPPTLELVVDEGPLGLAGFLAERQDFYDAVLISGADTLDLFRRVCAMRLLARARVLYEPDGDIGPTNSVAAIAAERGRLRWVDAVIVPDHPTAEQYMGQGIDNIHVIGASLAVQPSLIPWEQRADILFRATGRPGDDVEALEFIITQIMPYLDTLIGETYRLLILGAVDWDSIAVAHTDRLVTADQASDLSDWFGRSRVLVQPDLGDLGRAAARVCEAASYGVPSVTTVAVRDRLGWHAPSELLIATDAASFARQTAVIFRDRQQFDAIAAASRGRIAEDPTEQEFAASVAGLLADIHPTQDNAI